MSNAKEESPKKQKRRISEETNKLLETRKNRKRTAENHLKYTILSRVIHKNRKKT